ncbi:MAG TPA: hypothetical protein VFG10_17135 [Saprospiraceae bacterium]|nr:hypothetical protein [Saprospiraceae bacterium]
MKKVYFISCMLLGVVNFLSSQKQNNIWFFGNKAGLDFNFTPPKPITSDLFTLEGTASISDPAGHLLFYCNGATLWDRNQNPMPNGDGLLGGSSSTQAALIVPLPGSCDMYYVFTTEDQFMNGGLAYSVVDMCLNEGFGDVILSTKNTLVIDKTTEKVTAVLHSNGVDIWIITHTRSSDHFQAFLLTSAGLNTTPVVSTTGAFYNFNAIIGPVKASHDGTKIVSSATFEDICEMFDFNASTGVISNPVDLTTHWNEDRAIYGIEFSPNDQMLYLSGTFFTCYLYQLDLNSGVLTTLNSIAGNYHYGALQMGTDMKIYMVRNLSQFVDVIHQPDIAGTGCQYEEHSIDLLPGTLGQLGLPNFAPYSFFHDTLSSRSLGNDTTICDGNSILLSVLAGKNCPSTYEWNDGTTGPEKIVSEAGIYWVKVVSSCATYTDSIQIDVVPVPDINLEDVSICNGESVVLDATSAGATYVWSTGSTESQITVTQTGTYSVTVTNACASVVEEASISIGTGSNVTVSKDICEGTSFEGHTTSGIYVDTIPTSSGCDSISTLHLNVIDCSSIIYYDLEACSAFMFNGTNMDYTEFVPAYPSPLTCADVTANYLNRSPPQMNKHSCTPGVNGSVAMCVSSLNSCAYLAGNQASIVIEFTIDPQTDSLVKFTGLEFYEQAPTNYNWIAGDSGPNNYPTVYGIRILKNGTEIFRKTDIHTTHSWTLQSYSFIDQDIFRVDASTTFRIELLPYCPIGDASLVSAWDIDELKIFAGCIAVVEPKPVISGNVITRNGQQVSTVDMLISEDINFSNALNKTTDVHGHYFFDNLEKGGSYFLKGYKNDDVLNGVNTLDLIRIQKHLLSKEPFTSLCQYVAADVDKSGHITVIDILQLRKLLLGYYTAFPQNTSWRFGDQSQALNGSDISTFRELKSIESLESDIDDVNFMGIKIGDVNEDIRLLGNPDIVESRSERNLTLTIDNAQITEGASFTVSLISDKAVTIAGIQMALQSDDLEFVSIEGEKLKISPENYSFKDGVLSLSWNQAEPVELSAKDDLFRITFIAHRSGALKNKIRFAEDRLRPEAYPGSDLDYFALKLDFEEPSTSIQEITYFQMEPNPFHDAVNARFYMVNGGKVTIRLFDVSGRLLNAIEKEYSTGEHVEQISNGDIQLINGIMYCQLICNGFTQMQRVLKL